MTKVKLHGKLAQDLGRDEWTFDVQYPYEIFHALEANTNKLIPHLQDNLEAGYTFLLNGKILQDFSHLLIGEAAEVEILPNLHGSKGEGLLIFGFIILALVAWWSFPAWGGAAAATTAMTTMQTLSLVIGSTLVLGGISQMIAPTPDNADENERPENRPSYIFNGAVNTLRQGNPVPFGAGGPMLVGSQIVSAGIRSIDVLEN